MSYSLSLSTVVIFNLSLQRPFFGQINVQVNHFQKGLYMQQQKYVVLNLHRNRKVY